MLMAAMEEAVRTAVMAHGDASEVLQPGEEALHDVAFAIETLIVGNGILRVLEERMQAVMPRSARASRKALPSWAPSAMSTAFRGRCSSIVFSPLHVAFPAFRKQ